jgi:hypothetical protein
MLKAM